MEKTVKLMLMEPDNSPVPFLHSKFPDGQQNIKILKRPEDPVEIVSNFRNFSDLELIICSVKSLRRWGVEDIILNVPYLLGSRSDRQFETGGNSYLVDVVAPIINSLNLKKVKTLDVHSDVAAACINNLESENNYSLVRNALNALGNWNDEGKVEVVLISPDAGAFKKIYKLSRDMNLTNEIISCAKSRDEQGNINGVVVNIPEKYKEKEVEYVIIDDICDGGATFIQIANAIKQNYEKEVNNYKINLVVTHGIFSKGLHVFDNLIDRIFTTNSYSPNVGALKHDGMKVREPEVQVYVHFLQ